MRFGPRDFGGCQTPCTTPGAARSPRRTCAASAVSGCGCGARVPSRPLTPLVVDALLDDGIDIRGKQPVDVRALRDAGARFDYVIGVCDREALDAERRAAVMRDQGALPAVLRVELPAGLQASSTRSPKT